MANEAVLEYLDGMYLYHGILTNKTVATWFNLPFRDINLLLL